MMAPWMAYALVVAILLAGAARGAEAVLRSTGFPVRWVWASALALLVCLVGLAPARPAASDSPAAPPQLPLPDLVIEEITAPDPTPAENAASPTRIPRIDPGSWLAGALAAVARWAPRRSDQALILVWVGSTLVALGIIAATHSRLRRRRRRWPISLLHDQRVRVSNDFGPAVIGIARSEIVVPEWLLQLPGEDSRLVITHEAEHLRTRDPLLLFLGCVAAALLAWNPAAWWMLSHLRLAVEVDCDARMLRRGANTRTYASLLIRLVDRAPGPKLGALAVSARRSHLERRLLAMTSPGNRRRPVTTAAVATLASAALLAACAAELPNTSDLGEAEVALARELPADPQPPGTGDTQAIASPQGTEVSAEVEQVVPQAVTQAVEQEEPQAITPEVSVEAGVSVPTAVSPPSAELPVIPETPDAGDPAPTPGSRGFDPTALPEPAVAPVAQTPPNPFGPAPGDAPRTIVYLVDGVRGDVPDNAPIAPGHPLYGIEDSEIREMAVLICEQATRIVPEAIDGLIVVRTRNGPDDGIELPPPTHLRGVDSGTLRPRRCGDSLSPASVRAALSGAGMLIVDGQRATREQALAIPAAAIASISLPQRSVTPTELVEAYGSDAAEGVAVVTTRTGDWRPGSGVGR